MLILKEFGLLLDDSWCSYDKIEVERTLSRGIIEAINHLHLQMKKTVSCWVTHELTEQIVGTEFESVQKIYPNLMMPLAFWCEVVTGDEPWFNWRQTQKKQSNKCC
jgi:hypothetical protein